MHEPSLPLRLAMFHFTGGDGYLCGLLLFCLAHVGLIFNCHHRWIRPLTIAVRVGLIWSFVLPSPTPRWLLVLFAASLFWLCLADWRSKSVNASFVQIHHLRRVRWLRWLVVVWAFVVVLCELPYRFLPSVEFRRTACASRPIL